jgi:hypothetical protein
VIVSRPAIAIFLAAALGWSQAGYADCGDTDPSGDEDCDEDGWTRSQGDCDDSKDTVNPGKTEVCGDHDDNDCNGYFDDGCESATTRGTLTGGSSCENMGGSAFLLVPLLFRRRRG